MNVSCREIAKMIDHSLLKPNLAEADIRAGCAVALKYAAASVRVGPTWVPLARTLLAGSDVKVSTGIGFPHGYPATEVKAFEAAAAVREACRIAERAGADFVKTSTGFGPGGATFADLRLMRASVSPRVRVKAAGGIRELETALLLRGAGGARFGCTTTEALMEECRRRHGG